MSAWRRFQSLPLLVQTKFFVSALYMDSSSLANNFFDQNSDANVYLAFRGRRYLLAHYVYAHSGSAKGQWALGPQSSVGLAGADIFI